MLDSKLRELLTQIDEAGQQWVPDEECIAQIKKCFADEGYQRAGSKEGQDAADRWLDTLMTGQEWYNKFIVEVNELDMHYGLRKLSMEAYFEAARRAAGL